MENTLFRKYRPTNFEEIVGQDSIITILKKTAQNDTPVNAYLFSGSRGTGKTSTARVFAKALGGEGVDIFEIDAASSNSVEDIHNLNERVKHMPMASKYSVYILDEVHMLSKAAFNAFLKTLEEPPRHIVFILATTEIEKLPETIHSRCQIHKFAKPSISVTEKLIMSAAKKEGYKIEQPSAYLIALVSDGSLRDAYSNLQKVLLLADGKTVSHDSVENLLGVPKHEAVNTYIESLVNADLAKGIKVLEQSENIDMQLFADLVLAKVRTIILYKNSNDEELLGDYLDSDKDFIKSITLVDGVSLSLLKEVIAARLAIRQSYIKKLPLEMALLARSCSQKTSS